MSLVNHGIALAYVPDFVAKSHNLIAINVVDYAYLNQEKIELEKEFGFRLVSTNIHLL